MKDNQRTCQKCIYGCHFDFGYSNYTTEGTEFFCAKSKHPDGHFDEFYGDDKRLNYAEKCDTYQEGDGLWMDVEHENLAELTPEQKAIYDMCMAAQEATEKARPKEDEK